MTNFHVKSVRKEVPGCCSDPYLVFSDNEENRIFAVMLSPELKEWLNMAINSSEREETVLIKELASYFDDWE